MPVIARQDRGQGRRHVTLYNRQRYIITSSARDGDIINVGHRASRMISVRRHEQLALIDLALPKVQRVQNS